jgi:hypothetical protein
MIAAAQSISILWFPIIFIPACIGWVCAKAQNREEQTAYEEYLKRRIRKERILADELADALYFRGVKRVDEDALNHYEESRGGF